MMGKRNVQMQLITIDIGTLIPESHLLKKIQNSINFDFIYEIMSPYYSDTGRKSIDPISLIKMLLVGFYTA